MVAQEGRADVLFSGGLDSSLIAYLLHERTEVRLHTVGLRGAGDLETARASAAALGLPRSETVLDEETLRRGWNGWGRQLRELPEPRRSVLFSLGLAFASAPGRTLWIGQGADELFGGYAHFDGLSPDESHDRAREDLARLRSGDWPSTEALAGVHRVALRAPYLAPDFVELVGRIPPESRFSTSGRKLLLRNVARHLGLPDSIVQRPKRAMQYGTGVNAWLRRELAPARREADQTTPKR